MAKVIKLTDNNNNTLLPVTDASYIQMKVGDDVRSVKDVIIENEEITALALNDLHSTKQEKLISGVTIKTINNESLIGAGDINLPEVYDVRFVFSSDGWVCNHTYSEITTAFNDGKLIVGMVGTNGNSPRIDGYSISFGPLGFGDMTNIPDYCFLTAVRQAFGEYALFNTIMEYSTFDSSAERILITFKIDSNDDITVHAESIGGTGEATTITGGAANQIAYQTAANTTGFIDAPTDGTCLKYDTRHGGFVWQEDNNTDNLVKTLSTSTSGSYPVLFKYSASNTGETNNIRFDSAGTTSFYYNPSTNTLTATNITSTSISASEVVIQGQSIVSNYAKLASPTFTGTPKAPTAAVGTNTTQIATTAFVNVPVTYLSRMLDIAYCTTAAATAAKVANLEEYTLRQYGIVNVWFQYNVPASATLNINSTGAKYIRQPGATSNITAGTISEGDIGTFMYDGSYYRLIGVNLNHYDRHKLRYTLLPATNIPSAGITNMMPDTVYVIGHRPAGTTPNLDTISSLKILSLYTTGYGSFSSGSANTCPYNNSLVPTYQIMFKGASDFTGSIELPSAIKWRDNYAPAAEDIQGKVCELTIMNGIATMNMITV